MPVTRNRTARNESKKVNFEIVSSENAAKCGVLNLSRVFPTRTVDAFAGRSLT
jgi:hypothetical protein